MIKGEIKVQDYKKCIEKNKAILRSQRRFMNKAHNAFTQKINEIALSANDDKRMLAEANSIFLWL